MSYSSLEQYNDPIFRKAIQTKIPKGFILIVEHPGAEVLEDTTAHGCPMVKHTNGDIRATTIYEHYRIYKELGGNK